MDNIEQLLRLTPEHNITLLCDTNGEFQASIYFNSDYATDFCDGISATYWDALKALDANLGKLYAQYGLPLHREYEPVATPIPQPHPSEKQNGLSLAEVASCEAALLRYQVDVLSGKNDKDAMHRSFFTAFTQLVALTHQEHSDAEFSAFLVTVRDYIRNSSDTPDFTSIQSLFPQV